MFADSKIMLSLFSCLPKIGWRWSIAPGQPCLFDPGTSPVKKQGPSLTLTPTGVGNRTGDRIGESETGDLPRYFDRETRDRYSELLPLFPRDN